MIVVGNCLHKIILAAVGMCLVVDVVLIDEFTASLMLGIVRMIGIGGVLSGPVGFTVTASGRFIFCNSFHGSVKGIIGRIEIS